MCVGVCEERGRAVGEDGGRAESLHVVRLHKDM